MRIFSLPVFVVISSDCFLSCIWAMCVTIVTRMILNLREAETNRLPSTHDTTVYGAGENEWETMGYYELPYHK